MSPSCSWPKAGVDALLAGGGDDELLQLPKDDDEVVL
jgi:hypothetical protein